MALDARMLAKAERNITRWIAPKDGEPAHGFLLRLAARHYETSAFNFAVDIGIDNNEIAPDCLAAACASRYATRADKASLAKWTPTFVGPYAIVAGETLRRGDWSISTRRFCPACLAEDAYHRSWFDFLFIHVCPLHGTAIRDEDMSGAKLHWTRASVDSGADGTSLSRRQPRLPHMPLTLEAYVLGRLNLVRRTPNPLFDCCTLAEVVACGRVPDGGVARRERGSPSARLRQRCSGRASSRGGHRRLPDRVGLRAPTPN